MTGTRPRKCKFCDAEFSSFVTLRGHVFDKHPDEAKAIAASLPDFPMSREPRWGNGAGKVNIGDEFKKRMGYSRKEGD